MIEVVLGLLGPLKKYLLMGAAAAALLYGAYLYGHHVANEEHEQAALTQRIKDLNLGIAITAADQAGRSLPPPLPDDLRTCFDELVSPPVKGKRLSKGQVYDKFGEFIVLDEKKSSCGRRLIARDDALRTGKIP